MGSTKQFIDTNTWRKDHEDLERSWWEHQTNMDAGDGMETLKFRST